MPLLYLRFQFFGLTVHLFQIIRPPCDQVAHCFRQIVLAVFQNLRDAFCYCAYPLRDDDPELGEQAAYRVALRRSGFDDPLACAMCRQNRLLLDALHGDKLHVRPANGFTDRFRLTVCPYPSSVLAQ